MTRLLLALASLLAAPLLEAETAPPKTSAWNGYEKLDFEVAGKPALLVKPKEAAPGRPWIWRTEFFGHEPQGDIALLGKGWHVAFFKVSDMYGAPISIDLMAQYHAHVTKEYGLAKRAVLEGFSRGGLYAVNFAAAHPDKTAALYLDAPVLDIRSWPGGKGTGKGDARCWAQALQIYGLTEETAPAFKGNPLDRLESIAAAGIPILSVVGDADSRHPDSFRRRRCRQSGAGRREHRAAQNEIRTPRWPHRSHRQARRGSPPAQPQGPHAHRGVPALECVEVAARKKQPRYLSARCRKKLSS